MKVINAKAILVKWLKCSILLCGLLTAMVFVSIMLSTSAPILLFFFMFVSIVGFLIVLAMDENSFENGRALEEVNGVLSTKTFDMVIIDEGGYKTHIQTVTLTLSGKNITFSYLGVIDNKAIVDRLVIGKTYYIMKDSKGYIMVSW